MYFLVFLYSRGFIFHILWRTVTNACLSFILLCAAPVQPSTDSCKNYCKVPAVIFHRGHPDSIPDKSNKKDSRHWKNISQEMLLTKMILLLLSKGRAQQANFIAVSSPHRPPPWSPCTQHYWVLKAGSFTRVWLENKRY